MRLADITPLILTFNEGPNIRRCLERLDWASRIVVMDSGSSDATQAICEDRERVSLVIRNFDCHSNQWNAGLDAVTTPWVLALDADFIVPQAFADELATLPDDENVDGYQADFHYVVHRRRLRGTLYPAKTVLFRKDRCRYVQDGHTQLLSGDERVSPLVCRIDHHDCKPLSRWLDSQRKYAALEAEKLGLDNGASGIADHLRKMIWPAAPAAFLYTLFVKRLILDGWPGWFYALQRTYAEALLSLELLERRLASAGTKKE